MVKLLAGGARGPGFNSRSRRSHTIKPLFLSDGAKDDYFNI